MFEAFVQIIIEATQPRPADTAVDTVKRSRLGWVNELSAGLGHGRSVGLQTLREHRIGRNLGSDLSEGWVSARQPGRRCPGIRGCWAHVQYEVQMITHNRPGVNAARENVAKL